MLKLIEPVIDEREIEAVTNVLKSGWLTEGSVSREFEKKVADYVGVKHAIVMNNCTTAMELALKVAVIAVAGKGGQVVIPDFTHPATANAVYLAGLEPVLVDVDFETFNISADAIKCAVNDKTRAILPVSWGGYPLSNINELLYWDLPIVEDGACSLGADYMGWKTGSMSDITCFSFHPRKILTTGEGGMITTNYDCYEKEIKSLKNFGVNEKGSFVRFGTNYKLSDVLSAIGLVQFSKFETLVKERIELAKQYDRLLRKVDGVIVPERNKNVKHVYQTYCVYIDDCSTKRDYVITRMKEKNIQTQIGAHALHLLPVFRKTKKVGKLENSTKLFRNLLALPMFHGMTDEDQKYVVNSLKEVMVDG